MQIACVIERQILPYEEVKKLRDAADCYLTDGEKQQLVLDFEPASERYLAMGHSLSQGIADLHLPHSGHDRAIAMGFHAPQRRIRVRRRAIWEAPHQGVRSVQDEGVHSRPSSISSLMERSPSARPSRNSHKRDLRGGVSEGSGAIV